MKLSLASIALAACSLMAISSARAAIVPPRGELPQWAAVSASALLEKERTAAIAGGKPEASRDAMTEMAKKKKKKKKKATSHAS